MNDEPYNEYSGRIVNPIYPKIKWTQMLHKEWFCDVIIKSTGHPFYLHRIKLSSESQFFYDLFTNRKELLASDGDSDNGELKMKHYSLDTINAEMFRTIISYIHHQEIEIISETQLIRLLIASKILEIGDLFEACYSKVLQIVHSLLPTTITELFGFVSVSMKHMPLYRILFKRLVHVSSHPKLRENQQFKFFSLNVVQEILASTELTIDDPDDILDVCSEWICYDFEDRHRFTIELANFINRNFMMDGNHYVKLEVPSKSTETCWPQFVKNQLIGILSSNTLAPSYEEFIWKIPQPKFIVLKEEGMLSITDVQFNEIVPIQLKIPRFQSASNRTSVKISQPRATLIDDKLFIIFKIEKKLYFQVYDFNSDKLISLATDPRMQTTQRYFLLNCKDEIYFCVGKIILKYSSLLNRWFTISNDHKGAAQRYTSDGKNLYRILVEKGKGLNEKTIVKADYLDLDLKTWNALPDVPVNLNINIQTNSEPRSDGTSSTKMCWVDPPPIKVDIINNELNVLSTSHTYSFNWTCQTWNSIPNFFNDFCEFTGHEQKILYVSMKRTVYSLSPATQNKWTLVKKLPEAKDIVAIHTVHKYSTSNK